MDRAVPRPSFTLTLVRVFAVLLIMIGAFLLIGGYKLLALGGSAYYALAGIIVLATAVLLLMRRRLAVPLYASFYAATVCWALWEVGFDGFQLMPRLVGPGVVLALLLLPATRRTFTR